MAALSGGAIAVSEASSTYVPTSAVRPLSQPPVPGHGAYLGVDPNFRTTLSAATQLKVFEESVGSPVGIASLYYSFGEVPGIGELEDVLHLGAIPMINMKCGPSDASVTAGQWDTQLRAVADQLRTFAGPVFFRWFWEMNLVKIPSHAFCLGGGGPAGYIAAYRHIWTIFHQEAASNVAFVWAPSDARGAPDSTDMTYFPGSQYVGWIGADLYDRPRIHHTFGRQFDAFYAYWHTTEPSKPIILTETGATEAWMQKVWLQEILAALTRKVYRAPASPFTGVHGIVYVDAVDKYDYILRPGSVGLQEFASLIHHKYFENWITP